MPRVAHLYLDYSTSAAWLECQRKVKLGNVDNLIPAQTGDPSLSAAFRGTLVHAAIDGLYRGVPWEQTIEAAIDVEAELRFIEPNLSGSLSHIKKLITAYAEKYHTPDDIDYAVTATERRLEMPLSDRITYVGTIDKAALLKSTNEPIIVDHKTSSQLHMYVEPQVAISDQFTGYIALAHVNGIAATALIVDGISTALKALKDGNGLFVRYTAMRSEPQLSEWCDRMIRRGNAIIAALESDTFDAAYGKQCFAFNERCPFLDACAASGLTRTNILANAFKRNPAPWANFKVIYE